MQLKLVFMKNHSSSFIKRLTIFIIILCNCYQVSYSQFRESIGGLKYKSKAMIAFAGYATAGGGVILKGIAKPYKNDDKIIFNDVKIVELSDTNSRLNFITTKCNVEFSNTSGLIRDAVMFVDFEKRRDSITRDVTLLGEPTDSDLLDYSPYEYFYIEMTKPLIGTKSGEQLLLVDILMTDTKFYSDSTFVGNTEIYERKIDSLYKESLGLSYNNFIYNRNLSTPLDSIRVAEFHKIANKTLSLIYTRDVYENYLNLGEFEEYIESIRELHYPTNWTYNDEKIDYIFKCDCNKNKLIFDGEPIFTFLFDYNEYLTNPYSIKPVTYEDPVFSNYFGENKSVITNLRKETFEYAKQFAQTAAFFRYIKQQNPKLWNKIVLYYSKTPITEGNTPRIIKKRDE